MVKNNVSWNVKIILTIFLWFSRSSSRSQDHQDHFPPLPKSRLPNPKAAVGIFRGNNLFLVFCFLIFWAFSYIGDLTWFMGRNGLKSCCTDICANYFIEWDILIYSSRSLFQSRWALMEFSIFCCLRASWFSLPWFWSSMYFIIPYIP